MYRLLATIENYRCEVVGYRIIDVTKGQFFDINKSAFAKTIKGMKDTASLKEDLQHLDKYVSLDINFKPLGTNTNSKYIFLGYIDNQVPNQDKQILITTYLGQIKIIPLSACVSINPISGKKERLNFINASVVENKNTLTIRMKWGTSANFKRQNKVLTTT